MDKSVVVGLDPGEHGGEPLSPKFGSGRRLATLSGLEPTEFLLRLDRVNLYGRSPGDSARPADDRAAALNLLSLLRGRRVVALGRRVAEALDITGTMEWGWGGPDGSEFVAAHLPHPSSLSRWWNDAANVRRAGEFMKMLLRPCVHVEGPDGSGKTTLVRKLADRYDLRVVPTDDPPKTWGECQARVARRLDPGVVCDRSSGLVSELVYGPVLRGGVIAPGGEDELWVRVRALAGAVTFVYCRPPRESIRPTFRSGEDPDHVQGVLLRSGCLLEQYDEVMARVAREGCTVVRYDWTSGQTTTELSTWVGEFGPPGNKEAGSGEEAGRCAG